VSQLTSSEKVGLVTGSYGSGPFMPCLGTLAPITRLNYSGICMSDGPNGVNRADGVSVFASGITVAATWDRRLMYERGFAIGEEFRMKGVQVMLGYEYPVLDTLASQTHSHTDPVPDLWAVTLEAVAIGKASALIRTLLV